MPAPGSLMRFLRGSLLVAGSRLFLQHRHRHRHRQTDRQTQTHTHATPHHTTRANRHTFPLTFTTMQLQLLTSQYRPTQSRPQSVVSNTISESDVVNCLHDITTPPPQDRLFPWDPPQRALLNQKPPKGLSSTYARMCLPLLCGAASPSPLATAR